jgi:hypothetical protein
MNTRFVEIIVTNEQRNDIADRLSDYLVSLSHAPRTKEYIKNLRANVISAPYVDDVRHVEESFKFSLGQTVCDEKRERFYQINGFNENISGKKTYEVVRFGGGTEIKTEIKDADWLEENYFDVKVW